MKRTTGFVTSAVVMTVCVLAICFCMLFAGCTKGMARAVATWENDINQEFAVQDYKSRLYNYQWFFEQYNACVATANNAKLLEGDDRTGTLMVLNSMISDYNAKASQTMTAALWKAPNLPYQLTLADFGL